MQSRSTTRSSCAVAARIFAQGTATPVRNETPRTDVRPARRPASGLGGATGKTSNAMIRFSKVEIVCAPSLLAAPAFAVRSVRAPCGGVRFARTGSRRRTAPGLRERGEDAAWSVGGRVRECRRPHPDRRLPAVIPPAGPRDPFRARGPWRRAEPGPGTVR